MKIGSGGHRHGRVWRVLSNVSWEGVAAIVSALLGVVQAAAQARMLGPEGIGLLGLFVALGTLFSSLLSFTSAEAILTYMTRSLERGDPDEAWRILRYCYGSDVLTSVLAYLALVAIGVLLPNRLGISHEAGSLLGVYGLVLFFQTIYWDSQAVLRVGNKFSWASMQNVVMSIMKCASVLVIFYSNGGLREIVWNEVGISALNAIIAATLANRVMRLQGVPVSSRRGKGWLASSEIRKFQIYGYGRALVKSINRYADILLTGLMADPYQVGLFRASKQIADYLRTPAQIFVTSLHLEFSRLWFSGNVNELRGLAKRFSLAFLGLGFFGIAATALAVDWIVQTVLGPQFVAGRETTLILLISTVVTVALTPITCIPSAVGDNGPTTWAAVFALSVQVGVLWFLVPRMGAIGAAWSNVAYTFALTLVILRVVCQIFRRPSVPAVSPRLRVYQPHDGK